MSFGVQGSPAAILLLLSLGLSGDAPIFAQAVPVAALADKTSAGTEGIYYLDLNRGDVVYADRLRRDPIRVRRFAQNLFRDIGRPSDQPARPGELLLGPILDSSENLDAVLFVETSTGYIAYFDQLGRDGKFGRITTAIGRPFEPLAAQDGNYALLPRHDRSGRTEGAYLYHAATGRALFLGGLSKLESDPPIAAVSELPKLAGRVCAAEVLDDTETAGYLIADSADGSIRFLDFPPDGRRRLVVRQSPVGLFDVFAAEAPAAGAERFLATPIHDSGDSTIQVFFVDVASGEMALLENLRDPDLPPAWRKLTPNAYTALGGQPAADRILSAVPGYAGSGATLAVWLLDPRTGGVAYVVNPGSPDATIRRIRTGGG